MAVLHYCDHFEIALPPGHKFPMRKYRLLREVLASRCGFRFTPAPLSPLGDVCLVHDSTYVESFVSGTLDPRVMRRIGFPWSPALVSRTLASVGGTVQAARDALRQGWGGNLAGGTHHAFRGEGAGFCVFNDIAVAIAVLREQCGVRSAAVIDLDVHQGDGTAKIFEAEPAVLTLSIHGGNNFPFRKQRSAVDVPLPDGTGDDAYLQALAAVLPRVWEFAPAIVFYQSGVDALTTDRLGRLALTHHGLQARDAMVFAACRRAGIPCVVTLGGGYAEPIEDTVSAHAATFLTAQETFAGEVSA